jgi:hypothetical protein
MHVIRTVPRYRVLTSLLAGLERSPANPYAALVEFPVVTRAEVFSTPDMFRTSGPKGRGFVKTVSYGATGTQFETCMTRQVYDRADALAW